MTLTEYNNVKDLNYLEYCDYLQNKYGKSKYNYFTENWTKISKVSRTKEGLFAHHKCEDRALKLGDIEWAHSQPYEYQLAENLVYCDWLEHLFLHILITEASLPYPSIPVGINGIQYYFIPQLNDFYAGLSMTMAPWEQNCFNKIKDDLDCYKTLLKRYKETCHNHPLFDNDVFKSSYMERHETSLR